MTVNNLTHDRWRLISTMRAPPQYLSDLNSVVKAALVEDIGEGDISAALIPAERRASALVISREAAVICGRPWVDEVFRQISGNIQIQWHVQDGEQVAPNGVIFSAIGPARELLTGERSALNFMQLLSGTATSARRYADRVAQYPVKLLDTRKTIPGLRLAQKYAVSCGGCYNHRFGLYDAYLIKENHIAACGSINAAIERARHLQPDKPVEVEVENLAEYEQAQAGHADIIMLDNFSHDDMSHAVANNSTGAKLEASGGITCDTLASIAATGVDYISIGALTKDAKAIDLSMRLTIE